MQILLEKISDKMQTFAGAQEGTALRYRDLLLDPASREATREGERLDLTAREYALLETFLSAPGRVFTREALLNKLWGYDFFGDARIVDSHIKNLRHKLQRDYIETV